MTGFAAILLQWYAANKRQLPWRDETDPYRIWISEIILQQTRVQQGWDYYLRFVKRFPDVRTLAEASEQEVLKYWQGLGYYSRARNLHAGARYLCEAHRGVFPQSYDEILEIKGVGEYTAAAIASFAFKLPYPVVDGNVLRVLARYAGVEDPVDGTAGRRRIYAMAQQLIPVEVPDDFNQAMMDFGALQCVPSHPHCEDCPFQGSCEAFRTGRQELLPIRSHKVQQRNRYFHYWVLLQGDCIYLHHRTADDIWKGLYEFPLTESDRMLSVEALAERQLQLFSDGGPFPFTVSPLYRHVLSHQVIHACFMVLDLPVSVSLPGCLKVCKKDLKKYPVPKLVERYWHAFCGRQADQREGRSVF